MSNTWRVDDIEQCKAKSLNVVTLVVTSAGQFLLRHREQQLSAGSTNI